MELIELKASTRTTRGNNPAKALRRQKKIPAVLYGPNTETMALTIDQKELEKVIKSAISGQVLVNLLIDNGKGVTKSAMVKEVQRHPMTGTFLHIDFYEISMDRKIKVMVPVNTTGKCKGVETGGLLQIVRRDLEILCYPHEIPGSLDIDITDLDVGDSLHIEEIPLPDNVEYSSDSNYTVLTVISPTKPEEEEEEEVLEEDLEAEDEETEAESEET